MKRLRVLVACEFSGIVREAFSKRGHDAWSCDLLPTEIPGNHIQGDVLEHLEGWDLMIAHPPCTYLSLSGARWLVGNKERQEQMREAAEFFNALLDAPIERIAVENPLQHKEARKLIRKYDQIIQPLWFGETARKTTCLWLKNLPPLMATLIMQEEKVKSGSGRVWGKWFWDTSCIPLKDRGKARSRTFRGVAEAMAAQWS